MKCLEKDRTRRYETANGLALDVARHMSNEPVIARPPTVVYQLRKAWRRNKVICTAAAAVVIALLLGTGISVWQACIAGRARNRAVREEQRARTNEVNALRQAYNSDMSLAFRALEENLIGQVQEKVRRHMPGSGRPDFRGWEWRYAWAQSQSDALYTWDTPDKMGEVAAIQISPDERYLVSSDFHYGPTFFHHARRLWDFRTRQEITDVQLPGGSARGFAFSNSGRYLALHSGHIDLHGGQKKTPEIHVYDTTTWELKNVMRPAPLVNSLSFSPDDTTLATAGFKAAVLWDWREEKAVHTCPVYDSRPWLNAVAFFPDGQRLAIGGTGGLKIIDVSSGDVERHRSLPDDAVTALAVSPDSRHLAIGYGHSSGQIGLLNTASPDPKLWKQESPLEGHSRSITSLTFSRTGKWLMSSSTDHTIRVWDMNLRATTKVLKGHQSAVGSVLLAADDSRAVSAGLDKRICEWDLLTSPTPFGKDMLDEGIQQVVFSHDSRLFYTVDYRGAVSSWETQSFSPKRTTPADLGKNSSLLLSPDGNRLIVGTGAGELWVLDAENLEVVVRQNPRRGRILPVGFSADSNSLVTLESANTVSLWSAKTWEWRSSTETQLRIKFINENYNIYAIPNDSDVLLYPSGAELVWWDLRLSKEQDNMRINSHFPGWIAVSPTEPLLASTDRGDFLCLWNWQTRQPEGRLRGPRAFHGVAFSPDGRRLVAGSHNQGTLTLWDVPTRQEIAQFGESISAAIDAVQFSPDGNMICAVDAKGIAHFWRAPSLEEIDDVEAGQSRTERR
jgi:WD40 repeat protein